MTLSSDYWHRTMLAFCVHTDAQKALDLLSRPVLATIEKEGFSITPDMATAMAAGWMTRGSREPTRTTSAT